MTVAELVAALERMPDDAPVIVETRFTLEPALKAFTRLTVAKFAERVTEPDATGAVRIVGSLPDRMGGNR